MGWKVFVAEIVIGVSLWFAFLAVVSFLIVRYTGQNAEDAVKLSSLLAAFLVMSGGFTGSMLAGKKDGFDLVRHLGAVLVAAVVVLIGFVFGLEM